MEPKDSVNANRMERKKEETKQKIIDVAMDLFNKQGFGSTTMEQIAAEADIAKRTLYNHFQVKEAIISEYVRRSIRAKIPGAIQFLRELPDTRSRLIGVLHKATEWVELNKEISEIYIAYRVQNLFQAFKDPSLRSGFTGVLAKIIALGQETGELRRDIPGELLTNQLEFIHASTVMGWLADPEKFPVTENIARNVDMFLNGASHRADKE